MGHTVPWQDGRRAWERLGGWYRPTDQGNTQRTGQAALRALSDARLVRSLLGQAEYHAVRHAVTDGMPASEIAAHLGVGIDEVRARYADILNEGRPTS